MADAADMVAAMDARQMQQMEEALRADRERRIAESMRGYDPSLPVNCVECGEPVPPERIEAYPYTRRCVDCASEVERRYRDGVPAR